MTIDLLTFLHEYGSAVVSGIGAVLAALISLLAWGLRTAWRLHTQRLDAMNRHIDHLALVMHKEQKRLWDGLQGVRSEVALEHRSLEYLKNGILKLEGAVEGQSKTIVSHIQSLARIDSKLEALFRFVDAPHRSSDHTVGGKKA